MTSIKPLLILCLALAALNGCGFKLRGIEQMPDHFQQVYVKSQFRHEPLQRALQDRLQHYQVSQIESLTEQNKGETVVLYLYPESVERRLLSIFSTGQVAEYELIYTVRYEVQFPAQEAQLVEFNVLRDYQDDPDQVLAKSRELELVLSEMRKDASDRIVRLLASQAPARH